MRDRWPLLALLCALASLLVPDIAPANVAAGVETRVWAFDHAEQVRAETEGALTLELHRECYLADDDLASGSLLAAKGEGAR